MVRKNILENETGEWQNKSNLKSEFIKEASSFSVKKENVFTLCEKSIQENHGEKTALLKVQDMLDDFKFEVLRRMAGDRKVFELQSEKTEYEARIEHAEGKISGEQLQQKINVLEKEQETKIVKHERDKATIEELETKDVFLSNNSHESNDYLGAIAKDEKTKYFENKDLAEILASEISQSKQKLTGLKQHKRNEVADCNKKLNELNNVSQKNKKMMQEMSNTSNTLDPPNASDKVRDQTITDQTITDAKIVDKIKKLVKEFMRTENFEIIKTDTLEERYAKATAVDITREEVENRKDKAKKVLVETATIRRKKRQDRGSVLEQNQDQMNVSERVATFEKNGESKPDQTVSVKTPNKNGSNLSKGNKQQTNNSFNRSEDDLRDQVKPEPEPKSINRLSNSNLSKENEQQTNHSLDEPEVGLRKQAKPEIQATNSLPNGASEKDSANARPYSGNVRGLIDKFNSEKKDSHELQKGPRITFAQGHSQQEVSNPNGNKQQTNNSFNRSEDDLREQVKPEPINHLSNSNLSKENEQQTNHSLDESEVGLRKQAKPEIQATNSLSNGASEKDSANNRPVSGDVQSIINQFNSNKETSPELQKGPRITFAQGHSQQEVSNPNGNKQQTNNSFNRSEDDLRDQAKPDPESETKSINRLSNVSEIVSTFEKNGESKPDQTVSVKTPNKNVSNLPQGNKQQTNNSFNRSEDDLRKQAKPEIQATNSLANSASEKDSANNRPGPGHVKNLIHKFNNIEEKDSLVLRKGPKANFIHGLSQQEERRPNRIARSRSVSHTLHEVHREQTDKGRRNSAPELTMPSESPLRSEDRETSSPMYDDSLHERHLKLSDFELDPEKKPFDDTQFDKFQRFENDIPLRYIGKLRNLTNSERVLSSLSTTQDLKNHDKLVRRNSAPGVMTEQSIPSHSFDQFDRILIPRVKLRYVNGKVSLSKEITNQTAELNKFPELSSFTNQVLTPGDSLDQPSTPNSDSEINNLTNQVPLPKDSTDLRSVSEGDMNQTSMPENVNSTLDETDSVKKSVSVEDLKLAYVERLRSQVAFVEQKIKHDEELKKYGPYNNFFLDQSKKSKAARSKIEIDLTKNKTLCEGLKTILGDEKKLAEFLEEIQPKDPQVLAKELENVKQDTAELQGKAEELKEITYKDLKKKWYQVLTRPSFYLFLARQVLWVAPMAFFSAMAGALPLMPTGTQILHGSAVVNWLRGVIIGSYVGQRLVNAVPKIIPRTSKRVQRFAKERFPKTVAALEKGSKTIARPFKSIGKSVRSTARTIGRPLKPVGKVVARPYKFGKEKLSNLNAKTFVPIGKKIKETFDIAHSEKRSSEENQNLKKGLDANGQRLPFATRVKNAALMTTTNFAKRLWRNKVKTLIGVALFVGLATFGLPLLLTAALPAISGTLIASVAAIAVPALFTLLGVWVADKYLLKPLQNRLANRENAKREQLFTERSAKVQELGQHHSLTPDFNTRVARVAQIDNEKQTAEKQKTQTSQKTQEQESARTSISSISTLNKQTETDKVRLRDSVSRVLNNPTNAKQSSGRASVSSKNDHQRSEGYGR
ncbi:hypothetical protein OSF83_001259 [Enterococcus hirae]|uniref:hypothetical protein n=2 Tax=Enterococcus TaxID=1350 RepID=UPI0009C129E7|nr:hypothetical protein [Enterococcus hirae]EMF0081989.1 hypothetical protein [Enterococcus hirae]EMF0135597.1 hypothetical protein [Enterococcus hirae]EMF0143475.1 hypothetical protein [Enterococcus hirae]EMF0502840.1 hypothetical protein [Enterococcus hirae]EMF0510187.1 hypothetical protein [Enterococcus hirae]